MRDPRETLARAAWSARVMAGTGLIRPYWPDQVLGVTLAAARYGLSSAALYAMASARCGRRTAVVDEQGRLTFAQMDDRTSTLAAALADIGLPPEDRVAILCRNHRGFLDATVALAKLGVDSVLLNTGLAAPQLAQVFEREGCTAIIVDEELVPATSELGREVRRILAWNRGAGDGVGGGDGGGLSLDKLLAGPRRQPPPKRRNPEQIILTSGTTGVPKGAHRRRSPGIAELLGLLSTVPLRSDDVTHVAAPLFHAWGFAHFAVAGLLGSTLVLSARFDPEETLRLVEQERVTVLVAIPVMLQRIMDLPGPTRARYDTSALRVVFVSGSALPGGLATRFMDAFGDVLYNLYGSTEVAWVSVASPQDLRAAPTTAGFAPPGTVVRLLDDQNLEVAPGRPGRIFVGNGMLFAGYTGGESKPVIDGLMATGDVGHFDHQSRLFVDGRDDDMIVSGGENVFPSEVEEHLLAHPGVREACVVGVPDEHFGQRLAAFVVASGREPVTADQLKDHVKARSARYKVPRDLTFVTELPRNATGKVMRRQLLG